MAKMNGKWIALCSTAIGAIYTASYYITEPDVNAIMAQPQIEIQQAQQTVHTQPTQIPEATPPTQSLPSKQHMQPTSSAPTQQKQPQQEVLTKGKYKDGTYRGTGSNRRGSIEVAVTIK